MSAPPASLRFAHLSDVHLAPMPPARPGQLAGKRLLGWLSWNLKRHRQHRREVLDAIRDELRAQPPDHVLVTGDLINISLPEEYARAAAWLTELGSPDRVSLVPGNHDAYVAGAADRGWPYWAAWMRGDEPAAAAFPYLRRRGFAAIIGLSTAVPSAPGYASGRLGTAQLAALEALLRELAGEGLFRIVLLHHPALPVSRPRKALLDRAAFCEVIRRAGAELVLSGHEHRFHEGMLEGAEGPVPCFVVPSASLASDDAEKRGGYLRFEIGRQPGGWRLDVRLRRYLVDRAALVETCARELVVVRPLAGADCLTGSAS